MSLREVQSDFARLVTNDAVRQAARDGDISADGNGRLTTLANAPGVELHAATLKRKRLGAAGARLPMTGRVLGDDFSALFMTFAGSHSLEGRQRYDRDALAFLDWLGEQVTADTPQWASVEKQLDSAMRLDRCELRARLNGRGCGVALIDGRLLPGDSNYPRSRLLCAWIRWSPGGRLHRWVLRLPLGG